MDIEKLIKENPELLLAIANLIAKAGGDEQANSEPKPKKAKRSRSKKPAVSVVEEDTKIRVKSTKFRKSNRPNLFDSMEIKNSHKADAKTDKKLLKNRRPSERREALDLINVVCRCCGKKEKINPGIVYDAARYKCNQCSTSSG